MLLRRGASESTIWESDARSSGDARLLRGSPRTRPLSQRAFAFSPCVTGLTDVTSCQYDRPYSACECSNEGDGRPCALGVQIPFSVPFTSSDQVSTSIRDERSPLSASRTESLSVRAVPEREGNSFSLVPWVPPAPSSPVQVPSRPPFPVAVPVAAPLSPIVDVVQSTRGRFELPVFSRCYHKKRRRRQCLSHISPCSRNTRGGSSRSVPR